MAAEMRLIIHGRLKPGRHEGSENKVHSWLYLRTQAHHKWTAHTVFALGFEGMGSVGPHSL